MSTSDKRRAELASLVLDAIPAGEGVPPLNAGALAEMTGLSRDQVAMAVAYIRDHFPRWPLVSSAKGYKFSMAGDDVARFRKWRAKAALTTMRRLWSGAMKPYLDNINLDRKTHEYMTRQYDRIIEDLAELTA